MGINYLLKTFNKKDFWYGCEFIKTGKGKSDSSEQFLRYRSATLTTMYCLSALINANRYCEEEGEM